MAIGAPFIPWWDVAKHGEGLRCWKCGAWMVRLPKGADDHWECMSCGRRDTTEEDEAMAKFRKKPVMIEARQYDGENGIALLFWVGGSELEEELIGDGIELEEELIGDGIELEEELIGDGIELEEELIGDGIEIKTLEGTMTASKGDWIIKGVKGEFYPCKPDIFALTYEPAE